MTLKYKIAVPLWDAVPNEKDFVQPKEDIHDERIWSVGRPRMYFYPSHINSRLFAVICPGGAYRKLNPIYEGERIAEKLNAMGIHAYVLISRLPNQDNLIVRHEAPIQDAQRAVRLIRSNHAGAKVIAVGISAGGHLISTLPFYKDISRAEDIADGKNFIPDLLVMISSATIMDKSSDWAHQYCIENFGKELSTYKHVTPNHPPTFLAHATDDHTVSVMHSLIYAEALARAGVAFEMHVPSTGDHGVCHLLKQWEEKLFNFIQNQIDEKEFNTRIL